VSAQVSVADVRRMIDDAFNATPSPDARMALAELKMTLADVVLNTPPAWPRRVEDGAGGMWVPRDPSVWMVNAGVGVLKNARRGVIDLDQAALAVWRGMLDAAATPTAVVDPK
jgi:hypothetical protein